MCDQVIIKPTGGKSYQVHIGAGACNRLGQTLPVECASVALVLDDNVADLYAERVACVLSNRLKVETIRFPAGEKYKTRATKERIEDHMLAAGLQRDCMLVAVGGGVTLDLAGFVASTYLRKIPWIAMPTSLLAAVDASVGGKTGVNTQAGKNLVGTFHHPCAVLMDLDFLKSLPAQEVDNGLAEMVKHGVIADRSYLDELVDAASGLRSLEPAALGGPIRRSVQIKARVVSKDPNEEDLRQVLNFGHTLGHAIEAVSGFQIHHGLAVAAGMSVEAEIACRLGLMNVIERDCLRACLKCLSLPQAPPSHMDACALVQATRIDKKGRRGQPRYALPKTLGKMVRGPQGYGLEVDDSIVLTAIQETMLCCA